MTEAGREGERIAKVLARAGVASRRDAEAMVRAGRVSVNGSRIDSPALNVGPRDRIAVDGAPLPEAAPARLWLYHKPVGLVSTTRDEKGRATVFDALPPELGRVMSVGRLDLNSEGLLLLTNDGALKRRLELPSTGWLRKYRVRVKGTPTEAILAPLRAGLVVEGERFLPMVVGIDRQQGANAWLTIGLREGRNREIRRALAEIGLTVNRLIRVSYGPFQLGTLAPGAVEEVRPRVLREQLGETVAEEQMPPRKGRAGAKPGPARAHKAGETPKAKRRAPGAGKAGDGPDRQDRTRQRDARPGTARHKPGETPQATTKAPARSGTGARAKPKGGKPGPKGRD